MDIAQPFQHSSAALFFALHINALGLFIFKYEGVIRHFALDADGDGMHLLEIVNGSLQQDRLMGWEEFTDDVIDPFYEGDVYDTYRDACYDDPHLLFINAALLRGAAKGLARGLDLGMVAMDEVPVRTMC